MHSIKHKPPELWLPLYFVVEEFIRNWHIIFSSGFKLFPHVKRNLSVWGGGGFASDHPSRLPKAKRVGLPKPQAGHSLGALLGQMEAGSGSARREAQKPPPGCVVPGPGTLSQLR